MDLETKKRQFAEKLLLGPEFHEATMGYDQTALDIERQTLQNSLQDTELCHFERLFLMHGMNEVLESSLDIPAKSTTKHFNMVVNSLAFELVGFYPNAHMAEPSSTSIFARPDGLLVVSDSIDGHINGSELHFQWVSNVQRRGNHHPDGQVVGNFERLSDGRLAYFGDYNPNGGAGVRSWLNSLLNRGTFLSPMHRPESGSQLIRLVSGSDWSVHRKLSGGDESRMYQSIEDIEYKRFKHLPSWVQEMIGPAIQERLNLSL